MAEMMASELATRSEDITNGSALGILTRRIMSQSEAMMLRMSSSWMGSIWVRPLVVFTNTGRRPR